MSKAYAQTRASSSKKKTEEEAYEQRLRQAYSQATQQYNQDRREAYEQTVGAASKLATLDANGTYLNSAENARQYKRDVENYRDKLRRLGAYGYNTGSEIKNAGKGSYTQSVLDKIDPKLTKKKTNIFDRLADSIDRNTALVGDPFGNGSNVIRPHSTAEALQRHRDTKFQNAVNAELTRRQIEASGVRAPGLGNGSIGSNINVQKYRKAPNRLESFMNAISSGWRSGNLGALAAVTGDQDLDTSEAAMTFGNYDNLSTPDWVKRVRGKVSKWATEQADRLDEENQISTTLARDSLGTFGSMLLDAGIAGGQMALDFGASALTGGAVSSLGTMGVRVFGQANREAKRNGATDDQAFDYALGSAAVEILTEKIGNVATPFTKAYGGGALDDVIKRAINDTAQTKTGRVALTTLFSAASEGGEEMISGIMNPLLEAATYGGKDAMKQFGTTEFWDNLFHDFAVGALMGGFGMGGDAVSVASQQMRKNRADRRLGQTITEAEYQQRLIQAGLAAPQASRANQLAAQLQEGGVSGRRADRMTGQLYNAVNESETQQAMANRLTTLGVDAEAAQTIASGIRNEMLGEETRAERAAMEQYKAQTDRVKTEYMDAMMGNVQSTNTWARELDNQQAERRAEIFDSLQGRGETAVEQTANIEEGAQNDGQGVLLRGSERNDGTSAGGEVRGMEEGPGRDPGREAWYQPADRELSESAVPEQGQVTSSQIHPDGVDSDRLYQPTVKTKAMKRAERWAKQHGKKCVFFAGDMLTVKHTMPDGSTENVRCRGMIDGDTIYLRADDAQFTSEQIAKHETTHDLLDTGRISRGAVRAAMNARYSPEEIDSIISKYANAFDGMTGEEAWDEIICDAMGGMNIFARSDSQGKGALFRDILNSVYEEAQKNAAEDKGTAAENTGGVKFSEEADTDYMAAVERGDMETAEREVVEALGSDAAVETDENGQLVIAKSNDGHTIAFFRVTYEQDGKDKLRKALKENGHSKEEIRDVLKRIDDAIDFIADLGVEYEGKGYENLQRNFYADIITDVRTHKQVLSTLVRNGDYPVNLDLALVCKKRVAYMRMIGRLVNDGVLEKVTFGGDAIAKVNDILREKGFETACLGCFVESRRLQIQSWAETIANEWNRQVDKRRKNAPDFGFAAGKTAKLSTDELAAIEREYEGAKLNEKGNKKLKQADVENKMGQLLDTTPSLLQHLRVEDLLTPEGITALRQRDGSLFSLVQQRYGAASPKIVQDFNPYNGEIADLSFKFIKDRNGEGIKGSKKYIDRAKKKLGGTPKKRPGETDAELRERKREFNRRAENMAMRQYLYDIGGARMQSFSDFMIENVFDYIQMFADLAAKRLPMHGYSKEIIALRLFGMTGAKWNGSLIAHTSRSMGKKLAGLLPVKEASNGRGVVVTDPMTGEQYAICFDDYQRHKATGSFIQSIGMKDIFALQLDPRYSANVGSITIGVSDAQIRAMLNHPLFSMVIPYHSSGMLPEYAARVGVDMYNDYTDYQNTRPGTAYDKDGNEVESLRAGDKVLHADTHFDFNEAVQRLGDAKLAAQEYLEWCAEKHHVYKGKTLVGYETFLPKFSDSPEGYDFTQEENYYKLLEDFTSYDSVTGESAVQGDVKMAFPEENGLSDAELEAYKARLRETGIFTEKDIERYAKRAQMSFQDIVREAVEERYQYQKATEPTWEETVQAVEDALLGDESARSTPEERQQKRDEKKEKEKAKKEQHFSREATNLREANREAEKLRTQVEYWKGQTQRTTRQNAGPNEKDVLDVAKALVKDYDSTEDAQSIRADIRELARYVIRGEGQRHEISWEKLSDMAYSIAQKIVEPTVEIEAFDGMGEQIRKDLREARVDMTAVKGDFSDWNEIMRLTRGKMISKKGGTGIDTFWMEMQERYGVGVFPEDITHPADQLRYMAELYDQTQTQQVRKSEAEYYEELMWCRNDIIDRVLGEEIRQNPPTRMDKALAKADESKRRAVTRERERMDAAVENEREKRLDAVASERERASERLDTAVGREREKRLNAVERERERREAAVDRERERGREAVARERERGRYNTEKAKWEMALRDNAAMRRKQEQLARQAEKFAKEKKDYTERARQVKAEALEKQERKLKEHFREVQRNQRDRRSKTALWRRILAKKADFQKLATSPQQAASRHAPAPLAKALAAVADCFNIENRTRTVNGPGLTKALADLKTVYAGMKGDSRNGIYYDEQMENFLTQAITDFGSVDAKNLTVQELEQMDKLLRSFHHTITHANQFMTRKWAIGLIEAGRKWTSEVMGAAPIIKGAAGDFLNWQLRPDSFFARISGFVKDSVGERVQRMFTEGTERMLTVQRAFYQHFRKFSEDKRFDKLTDRGKKDLVDVGLKDTDGEKILLTRDMMLALYKHLSSEDNLEAAAYGGLEVPDLDKYYTGKVAAAFDGHRKTGHADANIYELQRDLWEQQELARSAETEADRAAAEANAEALEQQIEQVRAEALQTMLDVRSNISKMLTDFEKELVAASEGWMDQSAAYINEVTENMYGFKKAEVPKYWPMHRDTNFVQTDMRSAVDEVNLENWGSLKERVKSHAPIKLTGFIFELDNHTKKMSRFYGFAEVQRDFNKLYNTQLPSARSSLSEQVQKKFGSTNRKLGASGQQYIDAYIASISGADEANTTIFSTIRRNLPRATLTLNLRVAVSQLASIPTAAGEIGWGAMIKGMPRGFKIAFSTKAKNELAEKNVWFWQRYRGEGGMREFADMKEERNWFDRGWNKLAGTKVGKVLFNWCQDFDVFATASMWAMSEEYVKTNTKLKPGTEEFERRVGEVYRDVIRKTQPNYTETERSGLLRDKNELYKFLTMYKTQSNQNLNILYESSARFAQYKRDLKNGRNGVTQEDVKQAGRQLARGYTSVLLGGTLAFSILRAAANALLHNMDAYRDDDDEVTLQSILNGILKETINAFSGMFAFGSEIEEVLMAVITGEKYWGLSESAVSAVSDLVEQSVDMVQKIADDDQKIDGDDLYKFVKRWAQVAGIPADNAKKIYDGLRGHVEDAENGEFLSFESGVKRTGKTEAKKLVDAAVAGDGEKAKKAWEHLLDTKAEAKDPEDSAQNAVKKRLAELFEDGEISEKDAGKILQAYCGEDADGAADWINGAKCKKETGYYPSKLKEGWLEGAFGDEKAKKYLTTYTGKDAEEAEETLQEWRVTKKYGFTYDETGEMYAKGKISEAEAKKILMTYGDYEEADADEKVLKWGVWKKYGFDYDDTMEQYTGGKISGEEAAKIWSEYGGMSDEKIADKLLTADFLVEHPEVDEDTVTAKRVEFYESFGEGNHIPAADFMKYAQKVRSNEFTGDVDAKGESVPYSKQRKIVAWIDTLDLSPAQKTAIFATYWNDGKIPSKSYSLMTW